MIGRVLALLGAGAAMGLTAWGAESGWVMGWGANDAGQCEPPASLAGVVQVSAGGRHGLALREDGSVAAWGDGTFGQTAVPGTLGRVKQVAAGDRHNLVLLEGGQVAAWGDDSEGQLLVPSGLGEVVQVSAGAMHNLALRSDGTVVCWGANEFGQSTVPAGLGRVRAVAAGGFHSVALLETGGVVTWSQGAMLEHRVPGHLSTTGVVAIAAGRFHTVALLSNGRVATWGAGGDGVRQPQPSYTNVVAVAAGSENTLALQADGTVVSWSRQFPEGVVYPAGIQSVRAVAAGPGYQLVVTAGPVVVRQPADQQLVVGKEIRLRAEASGAMPLRFQWWHDGVKVSGGTNAVLVIPVAALEDVGAYRLEVSAGEGRIWSREAQVWLQPLILSEPESVAVMGGEACELRASVAGSRPLSLRWYRHGFGPYSEPVPGATNAVLTFTNAIWQWANDYWLVATNRYGMVTSRVASLQVDANTVPAPYAWRSELQSGDSVKLESRLGPEVEFRWQFEGDLLPGLSTPDLVLEQALPTQAGRYRLTQRYASGWASGPELNVAVERAHRLVWSGGRLELDAGTVWGLAGSYQWFRDGAALPQGGGRQLVLDPVGVGDGGDYSVRVGLSGGSVREVVMARVTVVPMPRIGRAVYWGMERQEAGFAPEMAGNLIGLGGYSGALAGLTADGRVLLGEGEAPVSKNLGRPIQPVMGMDTSWYGPALWREDGLAWTPTYGWCSPCQALEDGRYVQVSMGAEHGVGLRDDGTVKAWGYNGQGQCSVPEGLRGVVRVAAGSQYSAALKEDGTVVVWGALTGWAEAELQWRSIRSMASGPGHLVGLRSGGTVVACGGNWSGQCDVPSDLSGVTMVAAGARHSLALRSDGMVVGWGDNADGQCLAPPGMSNVVALVGLDRGSAALVGVDGAPGIERHPQGLSAAPGEKVQLEVRTFSSLPITYQWEHDGVLVAGATNRLLVLNPAGESDAGTYRVRVFTATGELWSLPAEVWVHAKPLLKRSGRPGVLQAWGAIRYPESGVTGGFGQAVSLDVDLKNGQLHVYGVDGTLGLLGTGPRPVLPGTNHVQVVQNWNGGWALRDDGVVEAVEGSPLEISGAVAGLSRVRALAAMNTHLLVLFLEGAVACPDSPETVPSGLSGVVQLVARSMDAVALRSDGSLVGLGVPMELPVHTDVMAVAAGPTHYLGLRADGTVISWGGAPGEPACDVPTGLSDVVHIAAGAGTSFAVTRSGKLVAWGQDGSGAMERPPGMTNVYSVCAGVGHAAVIRGGPAIRKAPADAQVVVGGTARFEVEAESGEAVQYRWLFGGREIPGAAGAVLEVGPVTPELAGFYGVVVTDSQGASSARAEMVLVGPPAIASEPKDTQVVSGGTANLSVLAQSTGPVAYRWTRMGDDVVRGTAPDLVLGSVRDPESLYRVVVSNGYGSVTSRWARVAAVERPVVVQQPRDVYAVAGEDVQLSVGLQGTKPLNIRWQLEGKDVVGATNAWLLINRVGAADEGGYRVLASNLAGTVESATARVVLVGREPQVVRGPASALVTPDSEVVLDVLATGEKPLRYEWYFNGVAVPGGTAEALRLARVGIRELGSYRVRVSNAAGFVESGEAVLGFDVVRNVVAWGTNRHGNLDVPDSVTNAVQVSATRHSLALREDGTVVAWGANESAQAEVPELSKRAVSVAAGLAHSLVLLEDGTVVAWGANEAGQVDVPAGATGVVAIACGAAHNLAVRGDGTVLGWGRNESGQATPPLTLTNAVSVAALSNSSIALLRGGQIQRWGYSYAVPSSASNVVQVSGGGRFLAVRADGRVVGWGPGTGSGLEGPIGARSADSGSSELAIACHRVALLAGGTVTNWGSNPEGRFTPPQGLSDVTHVAAGLDHQLAVVRKPRLVMHPADVVALMGEEVSFEVGVYGGGGWDYQWFHEGTNLVAATNATLRFMVQDPAVDGTYFVRVGVGDRWVQSMPAQLRVQLEEPYFLREPADQAGEEGGEVVFEPRVLGEEPLEFQWHRNGMVLPGATGQVLRVVGLEPGKAGVYSVKVRNGRGQVMSREALLTVGVGEVVLDNTDAMVSGSWSTGSLAGQVGTNVLWTRSGLGGASVRFEARLPRSGVYELSTRSASGMLGGLNLLVPPIHMVTFAGGRTGVQPPWPWGPLWLTVGQFPFGTEDPALVDVVDTYVPPYAIGVVDAVCFRYVKSPPRWALEPEAVRVGVGQDVRLAARAESGLPVMYQWYREGEALPQETGPELRFVAAQREDAGRYRVLAVSADGAVYSRWAELEVWGAPVVYELEGSGVLRFDWEGTARLQEAAEVAGPYRDLDPVPVPPIELPVTNGVRRFYRLVR